MTVLRVHPHPLLHLAALNVDLSAAPGRLASPPWLLELLQPGDSVPGERSEQIRAGVRALLRHGGYRPSGRGKPASEYLQRAAAEGALRAINAAVDVGNAVSLHSGLPISVVDLDRLSGPLEVRVATGEERYVFNPGGQELQLAGLPCLYDARGPCANAVKDSQRTKTAEDTTRVLWVCWGSRELAAEVAGAEARTRALLSRLGAVVTPVEQEIAGVRGPGSPPEP